MIKKPIYIYLIAFWVFIQYGFFRTIPMGILEYFFPSQPAVFKVVNVIVAILVIGLIVGLVQLRNVPRLISIALLGLSSFVLAKMFAIILLNGGTLGSRTLASLRTLASFPVMLSVNMSCIYYLFSKNFIGQAAEYRKQVAEQKQTKES